MRAKLMELTPVSPTRSRNAAWLNIAFTSAWQSSKVPSMASAWMLSSAAVVIMRRCTGETRPLGNSTTTSTWERPANASTAAPPVSPEVATTMVVRSPAPLQRMVHQAGEQLHRQVLEGEGGPVKQLEHEAVRPELDKGSHRRMAEGVVGFPRHAGEFGIRDGARGERRDHLAGDLGIGTAGESRDLRGVERRPRLRHIEAAVAGEPGEGHVDEAERRGLAAS